MKPSKIETLAKSLGELNESYVDLLYAMRGTVKEVKTAKQLWRDGNKSKLIKLGLALIVFPEPTPLSETIGSFLVVAGAVQQGIRRRALHAEDIPKTFQNLVKDLHVTKDTL